MNSRSKKSSTVNSEEREVDREFDREFEAACVEFTRPALTLPELGYIYSPRISLDLNFFFSSSPPEHLLSKLKHLLHSSTVGKDCPPCRLQA